MIKLNTQSKIIKCWGFLSSWQCRQCNDGIFSEKWSVVGRFRECFLKSSAVIKTNTSSWFCLCLKKVIIFLSRFFLRNHGQLCRRHSGEKTRRFEQLTAKYSTTFIMGNSSSKTLLENRLNMV